MFDLINNGRDSNGNGIGTEEGTPAEAYDINGQPLFDVPSANCTAFYADGQGEDKSKEGEKEEDNEADPDGDVPKDVAVDATTTVTDAVAKKKKISKRIAGYTPKEDVCLCRSWLAISQGAISGAEQKGKWKRVTSTTTSVGNSKPSRFIATKAKCPFKRDGPSSNKRPTSFAASLRLSDADPRAVLA
jgi:hypothetical protein